MAEESEELAELKAIVKNEQEVDDEEQLTEEELQQALSSPSLHRHLIDEESTECDEYDLSSGEVNPNSSAICETKCRDSDTGKGAPEELSVGQVVKAKPGEYQFQMLEHHIFKGKHGKKLYKCDICFAVYRHSFSLKRHFIRSHINYGYLCETDVTNCGINLSQSASLQTWKQNNAGQPMPVGTELPELYCCHSCVLFYDDLSQIKAHVDDCHRNTSSGTIEPIRIPCSECNMSFIQRHNLMRHIEVVHNGKRLYACKHCSKKFQTIADRKKHEKSQHLSKVEESAGEPNLKASTDTTTGQKRPTGTHRCLKCTQLFATYSELRSHVTKKHKEFYNPCGFCNKFCFSKKQLSSHLRQKHDKTAKENTRALKQKGNRTEPTPDDQSSQSTSGQPMSQPNQFQAYFHCSLCYRRFLTYGSLIRHKQIAHRPQHVRSCSRLTTNSHIEADVVEPYNTRHEFEFYRNLAQRVAENLLYYVDGKYVNPNNDYKVVRSPQQKQSSALPSVPPLNLSKYNFPSDFTPEASPPPTADHSEKLEFLFDCNLNTVKNPKFKPLMIDTSLTKSDNNETDAKCHYLCTVCRQKISGELMAEHEANNHPNVFCSYIKVEPQMQNIPSQLLLWHYHSTEGLLHRCPTAPSLSIAQKDSNQSVKCTKCEQPFASVSLLHNHILECAHNSPSKKSSNKSQNNAETQTPSTTSVAVTTEDMSLTTTESLDPSGCAETREEDFSSPLSPCKTRSGKRRQISPEDSGKTKRTRKAKRSVNNASHKKVKIEESDFKAAKKSEEMPSNTESTKNLSPVHKSDDLPPKSSPDSLPKRYSCKKCCKKFVYMDSLSKHQMSCNQRVINSRVNTKRKLRNSSKGSQKLAKNIEIKAIKNIQKSEEKRRKSLEKFEDNLNETTADESEDKTEEEEVTDEEKETDVAKSNDEVTKEGVPKVNTNDKTVVKGFADSPAQHQCPDCLKVFIYLRNFRKHITNGCPIRKTLYNESATSTSVPTPLQISVVKEEKLDSDDKDLDCDDGKNCGDDEEVVFEGEHNGEGTDEDAMDISVSSKEESKLDLWRVKQENPQFAFKGSPAQHHSCPYCQRGFTYLANYRKHIKNICPIRLQIEEKKKQVIDDSDDPEGDGSAKQKQHEVPPTLAYTPSSLSVRSQIEDTVLTMLRDQTKQNQILQSSEDLIKSEGKSEELCVTPNPSEGGDSAKTHEDQDSLSDVNGQDSDKNKDKKETKGSTFKFRTFSCNICHKIFLSYVTMLKHRLSHKLSHGQSAPNEANHDSEKCGQSSPLKSKTDTQVIDGAHESSREREAANQALAATILKRSKEMFGRLSANNAVDGIDGCKTTALPINTTDLLEKLARGGITTDAIQTVKSSGKSSEVVTIETNNNNTNILNLQLSASTSNDNKHKSNASGDNAKSNSNSSANNANESNSEEIIINANDLDLNILNDGDVIVSQDLQQLIAVNNGKDSSAAELPVNEVLLNLDDIENANEVWITITDSSAFVQVPNTAPNPGLSTELNTGPNPNS